MKKNIYFFQWISDLGGADTRLKELIQLLSENGQYNLFSIPNDKNRLNEKENVDFLKNHGVKIITWEELPEKDSGYGIAFCNFRLFSESWRIKKIKSIGLKFIWSNDMMWSTLEESECIKNNYIDAIIFTSKFHRYVLNKKFDYFNKLKNFIIPNYFHIENYKKINKYLNLENKFVVGKLSRASELKFSENFPLFYDKMPINNPKFRIMGWNEKLRNKFSWFDFTPDRWDLLPENNESIIQFLSQLDLYVFNAHHEYIENQTRAIVEAQLLGIPALAPNYGNFPNMIWHGRNGFIYNNIEECYSYVKLLNKDKRLYNELSSNSYEFSKINWTNKKSQLEYWENIFNNI
jgi:glycosyltransferase involved in cell wall biosynthesis